jgi:hypothetical protein
MKTSRKLRLALEDIHVETFKTTGGDEADRGTVHGHQEYPSDCSECSGIAASCYCPSGGEDYPWNTCAGSCIMYQGEPMLIPC